HKSLRWSMRSNEDFWIYIPVLTDAGLRYLSYTSKATDTLGSGEYIQFGLGADAKSGAWRTFTRDLEQDLKRAQPDRELLAVQGFMVRGSLYIDDIHSLDDFPTDLDTDADGIEDQLERERYGSNPSVGDSDGDGIGDGDELDYWGKRWNDDIDGDGVINLLDPDADNDGLLDGAELEQGTDPGDPNSAGNYLSYEDAEDSNTLGWDVYDASPGGNSVRNVANPDGDGRVIKLSGHGLANGYRLRRHNGQWWQNKDHTRLSWDMKYSEFFTVYIAVQTSQGFRYLYYTPVQKSDLGDGKYIQFGLGTELRNGQWHSVERDLAADLEQAQPGNRLLSIEGFLIRGSGYVDNIEAGED
ncbi:MAG: thrombospondin type 3 repeat-containing protein, partial [Cellvibrionaceae bacterium]|nr:thrombospondin type 3 repeat-containing protein [Cellvibrionaceae bacterium]